MCRKWLMVADYTSLFPHPRIQQTTPEPSNFQNLRQCARVVKRSLARTRSSGSRALCRRSCNSLEVPQVSMPQSDVSTVERTTFVVIVMVPGLGRNCMQGVPQRWPANPGLKIKGIEPHRYPACACVGSSHEKRTYRKTRACHVGVNAPWYRSRGALGGI